MKIGELFIELGFHADTLKLKDFMHAVGELNMSSVASALGLGTLYAATAKIMGIADDAAMSIWGFSQTTGIGQKETQQFTNVVEQLGGTAQDAMGSLKNLQQSILNVQLGRGNIEPFILAGIDPTEVKDVFDLLEKLQKFLKDPSIRDSVKEMVVAEFGLSQSMIPILKNTESITEAMRQQMIITDAQIDRMTKFHKTARSLGQDIKLLFVDWATAIEPLVEGLEKSAKAVVQIADAASRGASTKEGRTNFMKSLHDWVPFLILGDLAAQYAKGAYLDVVGAGVRGSLALDKAVGKDVSNDIKIFITGVTDPKMAALEAAKELKRILSDRYYHDPAQVR